MKVISASASLLWLFSAPVVLAIAVSNCKCYEGDACWPSTKKWAALNATVGGRLQKVIPPAASCYNNFEGISTYNADQCSEATAGWSDQAYMYVLMNKWPEILLTTLRIETGTSPLRSYPSNNTCLPTTDPNETCTIGYLSEYVIMATTKEHVKAGIDFARTNNVRLVVRNTGHDFMGRSIASGALAINTHSMKGAEFTTRYAGPGGYSGGAVKLGAGMQGGEIYKLANQQNPKVVVVGGECPTVGFAGGYLQGGGHGPLSTFFGMAADHALSFDVVTADGQYVCANANENPDLFWALKGGGPATFGVVTSVTVKTFAEVPAAGTIININSTHTNDSALFWKAVDAFHGLANHYVDHGIYAYYELMELRLHIQPFVAPNMTPAQLTQVLNPLFEKLDALQIPYSTVTKGFSTFFDLYIDMFEGENAGDNTIVGGRFFTRKDIAENQPALTKAFKNATSPPGWNLPGILVGHIVGPGIGNPVADNAIHPGWRQASSFSISVVIVPTDASKTVKKDAWNILTNVVDAALIKAAPNGGAYVNEVSLTIHPQSISKKCRF